MARKLIIAITITAGLLVSACNTVEGAKKDAKSAGDAVEKAVD